MNNRKYLVTQSSMPPIDEYIGEIRELWESRWLTNMGVKHGIFEQKLKEYLEVNNVALCANGHLALESILTALKLTGEVITTPFTFVSTANAIVRSGLKPVFCDINDDDYTIDVSKIEQLITSDTVAIMPVHVYGHICDTEKIAEIADRYKLKVIYDAAHAFGVKKYNKSIAYYGDASVFSFHATKVFNSIEGGAVIYQDADLENVLYNIKNFGITGEETVDYIGGNAKMNEFQAAMGICNLRHLNSEINKRKKIYMRYLEQLDGIDEIRLSYVPENITYNFSYFPVYFKSGKVLRDKLYNELKIKNIFARKYFYPLVTQFDCYKDSYSAETTPVALRISEGILTLPMYAELSLEDVDLICKEIKKIIC